MAANLKEIENEMDEIQMLMKIWYKFYKILTTTFYDQSVDIHKIDPEFQQIKQIVAEHHAHFMKVIKKDFHIGQSILTTVKRTISLDGFKNLSPLEINKTLIEWHDANILLNETLGSLECDRDMLLRGRKSKSSVPSKKASESAKDFFTGSTFKLIVNLAIIVVVIGALAMFWGQISESAIYKDYLAWMIDPLLKMVGIESAQPDAASTQQ